MAALTIDLEKHSNGRFRIDTFSVPEAARGEFEEAMRRSFAFLERLPGFPGQAVFERAGGATAFNIVTIAAWESEEAMQNAAAQARAYYESIGFDVTASLERWGVRAEIGNYTVLADAGDRGTSRVEPTLSTAS